MSDQVLLSICIPAYKRPDFLQRLLDSIQIQLFRNFEVIVTDDSPDQDVRKTCLYYAELLPLRYFRNETPAGTPANWNKAIQMASGQWIKLMHDDDWFATEDSLDHFVTSIRSNLSAQFVFSAYTNEFLETGESALVEINNHQLNRLTKNPVTLFAGNLIGPPSVVMFKANTGIVFDENLKWLVDVDFYIRFLKDTRPVYLPENLIKVGIGAQQVTQDCFLQRPIEIPENFALLNKVGVPELKDIRVYDAWWRLMRNLEITNVQEIRESGYPGKIPEVIISMIDWEKKFPQALLKNGFFSKALMMLHYIFHIGKIKS